MLALGVAAVITVPLSLVLLVLVLAQPSGAGLRIREWPIWRRLPGLRSRPSRGAFAALLCLYGVVIPGACCALLVGAVRGTNGPGATSPATGPVAQTTPEATTAANPTSSAPSTDAVPTAAPPPAPADPCHSGGVTFCALNPAVTQATIEQTICHTGWTSTVRPPESYTETLKSQQIAAEGLPGGLSDYEEDHRMPLALGGAPSDPMNLSPESPPSPNSKDSAELTLRDEVCGGDLTLLQAQQQLVAGWLAPYPRYTH